MCEPCSGLKSVPSNEPGRARKPGETAKIVKPAEPVLCEGCPFAFGTIATEMAYNYACLPTVGEIREMKKGGINWCCHDDPSRPCTGFVVDCHERGVDPKSGRLASFEGWHRRGEP